MSGKSVARFRMLFLKHLIAFVAIGILCCSTTLAQKTGPAGAEPAGVGPEGTGSFYNPFAPGIPPSVDLNKFGIESLMNGGLQGQPINATPFTRISFSPVVPEPEPLGRCSIGIDPAVAGLLLRDPQCIRLLNPIDPFLPPPFVYFGPTQNCGIGIDPNNTGLSERDVVGLRLLGGDDPTGENNGQRLLFGPTDDCTIGLVPNIPGLALRDPACIRLLNPFDPIQIPPFLYFGRTNECGFGIVEGLTGLVERDPGGLRLLGPNGLGCILTFGPTDLCRFYVDPNGPGGIIEEDPVGLRLLGNPDARQNNGRRLLFGPTDDCSIGVGADPALSGLVLRDPSGIRIRNLGSSGQDGVARLIFGPTNDCRLEVDPVAIDGLRVYDPTAIRICNPIPIDPTPPIWFGPDDLCGIAARDNGLRLYDVTGIRICNPIPADPVPPLLFGPDNLCRIQAGSPNLPGLRLYDVGGIRICSPTAGLASPLRFGEQGNAVQFTVDSFFDVFFDIDAPTGPQYGIVRAEAFQQVSSKRWKTNIATIENPLEKIEALRGVSFDWDKEHGGKSSMGLIAEEVAEVVPELVSFEQDGKTAKSVSYSNLVGLLIEGVKQQQQQLDAQQTAVDTLRAENANLKAQLEESRQVSERTDQLEDEVQLLRQQLEVLVESLSSQK